MRHLPNPLYSVSECERFEAQGLGRWIRGHFISPDAEDVLLMGFEGAMGEMEVRMFTSRGDCRASGGYWPQGTLADVAAGACPAPSLPTFPERPEPPPRVLRVECEMVGCEPEAVVAMLRPM